MSLVVFGDSVRPVDDTLWQAIEVGDEAVVRILLDQKGASLSARRSGKQNALHLAVISGNEPIVQLLIEKGADIEAAGGNGKKPLYIAAELGNLVMVKHLLHFNADVESFNAKEQYSALYKSVQNGHEAVAQYLLQHGADVDRRIPTGETPLFDSVVKGNTILTALLLQFGANRDIRSQDGRSVFGIATGDDGIMNLLKKTYLLQGPVLVPGKSNEEFRFSQIPTPPDVQNQIDEVNACRGFEMTMIDFYVGKHEQRVVTKSSVWDVLYGQGPDILSNQGKESLLLENDHRFRWYHLPANNMAWVEALVSRLSAEKKSGAAMLTDEFKSSLGLTNAAGQQYQTATAQASFMRPLFRFVKSGPETSFGSGRGDHVMLFMPYLHFEYYNDYEKMSKTISNMRSLTGRKTDEKRLKGPTYTRMARRHLSIETLNRYNIDYEFDRDPNYVLIKRLVPEYEQDFLWSHTREIRERREQYRSGTSEFEWVRKKQRPKRAFRREILHEARQRVKAAARILKGTRLSDDSDNDSDYDTDGGSSSNSDDRSIPDEGTHQEIKKILLGSERLSLALQGLKTRFRGNTKGDEGVRELEEKEEDNTLVKQAENDHETRIILRRAMTELQTDLKLTSEKKQDGKAKTLKSKSDMDANTSSSPSEPTVKHDQKPSQRRAHRKETNDSRGPTPLITFLAGGKPQISVEGSGHLPPPGAEHIVHSRPRSRLSANSGSRRNLASQSEEQNTPPQEKVILGDDAARDEFRTNRQFNESEEKTSRTSNTKTPPVSVPETARVQDYVRSQARRGKSEEKDTHQQIRANPSRNTADSLNESLIMGYLFPKPGELPFLQPRRSLDQYFYTHLDNTSKRDRDQVVYRYTQKREMTPRIFMVDQLWLWILNEDTIISCCPQRWKSWTENLPPSEDPEKSLVPIQDDPLNVHQMVLKSLKQPFRAPIASAFDLANLITDSCASVFDPFKVPDEFQFLDFFERSIGAVSDDEAKCFQEFTERLKTPISNDTELDPYLSVTKETELLVEIKDIRDELSILQMVLNDQASSMADLSQACSEIKTSAPPTSLKIGGSATSTRHKVIESHLWRITRMEKLAENTYLSLSNLIDLKQKQASISEALSARKQAENTFRQAENTSRQADYAARQAESTAEQAAASAEQAVETTKQGKTVLVFTVVTIIFLPLSFMAAFFAIAIEAFPFNSDGKLGLDYVLKYMLSVSGAISVPLIFVAFNQDRMARWFRVRRRHPGGSLSSSSLSSSSLSNSSSARGSLVDRT